MLLSDSERAVSALDIISGQLAGIGQRFRFVPGDVEFLTDIKIVGGQVIQGDNLLNGSLVPVGDVPQRIPLVDVVYTRKILF